MVNVLSGVIVMQLCEECGAELPNDAQFCGHCGRKTKIEDEITKSNDHTSVEDTSIQAPGDSPTLSDLQELASENEKEDQHQETAFPSENSPEEEQHISYLTSEEESEEPSIEPVAKTSQEEHSLSENEIEEPAHHGQNESTSSMLVDSASEPEILTNQFPDDQPIPTQTPKSLQETQSPYASVQKPGKRPVSKCLLFSLTGMIVIVGVVVTLLGLFRQNLPVFGASSNVLSSSSNNEIIDPAGSSLTASVCMNTSTPSSSATNQGSSFTLSSSTGCSNVVASKADSSCLIFLYGGGNSHKYIVDISNAAFGNSSYHLVLGIVDYALPAMYSDGQHISVGLSEGSTGRNFSWFYRSGSVTVNHDAQSGSMDIFLVDVNGGNTLHLVGEWACGRQIKNT